MIHFDAQTRTFNLNLRTSYYAFQVDAEDRLVHLGWGRRPDDAGEEQVVAGQSAVFPFDRSWSFVVQFRPDEILTFGDVTTYQTTIKARFPSLSRPLAEGEASHVPIRDLRLRYSEYTIATDSQPGYAPVHGLPVRDTTPRQTLRVVLVDPVQSCTVTACYRLTPEHDIIERWLELENTGRDAITFDHCYSASLHLPNGCTELTSVNGSWAREFCIQRSQLTPGSHVVESRTVTTGHNANPFFFLNNPGSAGEHDGIVYFGALAYSGSWQFTFEQLPTWDIRVHGGYNPFDSTITVVPGDIHRTPAFVTGLSTEGWGGASRSLHAFTRERVLPVPAHGESERPVLYNSWEATAFDLSYENQVLLARTAAAIGVELFCVDDGWFGGRRSDRAGRGDWVVSADVFPEGLEPLVAEIERLGMKFGLWVEPEMVNPDSDLYRAHPDWVLHFPGRPRTESRNQLVLDFGRPEVVEYLFDLLNDLVRRYRIAFFKWDMNRMVTEPGSVAGTAIWRAHVKGVYNLMDRLREAHPTLEIQSCSGGGGRIDLGILARTDQVWASDNTDAFDRMRIQEGFSLAYPARTMEAWVTHEHNHMTRRVTSLQLRFALAIRGVLGIGSSLDSLSQEELDGYASYIAFYKRIRHVIQQGHLYRLQRLDEYGSSIHEYCLPDGSEAVYSLVVETHPVGSFRPDPPLRGLRSNAIYRITDEQGTELESASGYQLMTLGFPGELKEYPGYSRTLYVRSCS